MPKPILRRIDCSAIKKQVDEVQKQIRDIEDALSDPDIPRRIKESLRRELPRLRLLLRRLIAAHDACRAQGRR